jgi:hypothetical protein
VLADLATIDDRRRDFLTVRGLDPQLDQAVGEQQTIAGANIFRQTGERRRQPSRLTGKVAGGDLESLAGSDRDRPVIDVQAGTNLRPGEILQDRHFAPGPFGCRTHTLEGDGVRFMSAMRKVETDDVGPRIDQRIEDVIGAARRADGRDDFSVTHGGT